MKKIPTLYKREFSGHKIAGIRDEIMPGCEAALTDESIATLKLDGACCAIINGEFYKRFEGIRRGLELAAMEGIVFWHEGAPLCKIKRKDFGFKWPVTQDELNAEFGANNPDPCELVRRTAAMYSRHEFPTDMTKMFEAEHEATKEEAKA